MHTRSKPTMALMPLAGLAAAATMAVTGDTADAAPAAIVPEHHECIRGETYEITLATRADTGDDWHDRSLPGWTPGPGRRHRGPAIDWNGFSDESYLTVRDRCGGEPLALYVGELSERIIVEDARRPGEILIAERGMKPAVQQAIRRIGAWADDRLTRNIRTSAGRAALRLDMIDRAPSGEVTRLAPPSDGPRLGRVNRITRPTAERRLTVDAHDAMIRRLEGCRTWPVHQGTPLPSFDLRFHTDPDGFVDWDDIRTDALGTAMATGIARLDAYRERWIDLVRDCTPLDELQAGWWRIRIDDDRIGAIEPTGTPTGR